MTTKLTIDKAGRVVIPKRLRDSLRLMPGDELQMESHDEEITLKPIREVVPLHKKQGIWVYRSMDGPTDISIPDLIDRAREERDRSILGE